MADQYRREHDDLSRRGMGRGPTMDAGRRARGASADDGQGFGSGGGIRPMFGEDNHRQSGMFVGRGPKGYRKSDERIREDISDRLTEAPDVDASELTVEVSSGDVTLTGTVQDRAQKRRAEDIVEECSGVSDVINNLRVQKSTDAGTQQGAADRSFDGSATQAQQTGVIVAGHDNPGKTNKPIAPGA